jgi:hypothetical protein
MKMKRPARLIAIVFPLLHHRGVSLYLAFLARHTGREFQKALAPTRLANPWSGCSAAGGTWRTPGCPAAAALIKTFI